MTTHPLSEISQQSETQLTLRAIDVIDTRAGLLDASRLMQAAALGDTYSFLRDSYLQQRLNKVHDGNPPEREEQF